MLHAGASWVGLSAFRALLPERLRHDSRRAVPLVLGLSLLVPLAGLAGLTAGFLVSLHHQRTPAPRPLLRRCRLPGDLPAGHSAEHPENAPLRALGATRRQETAVAVPKLHDAVAGDVDELRLLAHALLVSRERAAAGRLALCTAAVLRADSGTARLRASQAHADLAESGLVDGEVRRRAIDDALSHALAGLSATPADGRLHFVRARMLLAQGKAPDALTSLRAAAAQGLPQGVLAPYLWRARMALRPRLPRAG
jgi:hypothetical protein